MTTLTPSDVRRIARLARLRLADDESARLARELGDVLGWIARLDRIEPVDAIESDVDSATDASREADDRPAPPAGAPGPHLDPAGVLDRAPAHRDGSILVPES